MPQPPYSPQVTFLCFPRNKSPQREMFADMEEVKQKMAEALKGIRIDKFQNCFKQWEKKKSQ